MRVAQEATSVLAQISHNLRILAAGEFRPYFITKPPHKYFSPSRLKPAYSKISNPLPPPFPYFTTETCIFKNRKRPPFKKWNSRRDSILQSHKKLPKIHSKRGAMCPTQFKVKHLIFQLYRVSANKALPFPLPFPKGTTPHPLRTPKVKFFGVLT